MRTALTLLLALAAVTTACGSSDTDVPDASERESEFVQWSEPQGSAPSLVCDADFEEIISLLRSGLPSYDYEAAGSLEALIEQSHGVVAGEATEVARIDGTDGESWSVLSGSEFKPLRSNAGAGNPSQISIFTSWPYGVGPDPLADPMTIEGLSFVAFLFEAETAPGRYSVGVQGLVVGCSGVVEPPVAIIEPLPADATGLSLAELIQAVESIETETDSGS